MFLFGAGTMTAVPLQDSSGTVITTPTPAPFGTLQDVTLDFDFEKKPLYGERQFPVALGRGKGKLAGKCKQAKIFAALFNSAFFGQTLTAGFFATYTDTTGTAIPDTPGPYTITVVPPSSGTWDTDLGVTAAATGKQYKRVSAAPATGEYSVAAGVYTFAAVDKLLVMFINYRYTATVTGAQKSSVANLLMGYAPIIQIDLTVSYAGKAMSIRMPNSLPGKMSMNFKNDDWTIPDFDWECFADNSNNVAYYSMSE